jgi:DNA processing protein
LWEESPFSLSFRTGLAEAKAAFLGRRQRLCDEAERLAAAATAAGCTLLALTGDGYPEPLRHIHAPPAVLYCRGNSGVLARPCTAVVGTRHASPRGMRAAWEIARRESAAGRTVVSGAARGIDGAAHQGALDAGSGLTAAVLGCGIDQVYPAMHRQLLSRIAAEGVVLSEFPPGTVPLRAYFPMRNRIIAGLAATVVVVEAPERSGALITARMALEEGREVQVCPWDVRTPRNLGVWGLQEEGAAWYDFGESGRTEGAREASPLLELLREGPQSLNGLLERLGLLPQTLLPQLMRLQLDNRITARSGCFWLKTGPCF